MSNDLPLPEDKNGETGREAELSERLDRLDRSLNERRRVDAEPMKGTGKEAQGYAQAFRLSTEFVAGVLVGAALGWAFDRMLGTSPWGLIVLLLLGFGAGVFNVMRAANLMAEAGTRMTDQGTNGKRRDGRPDDKATKG